MKKLFTLTLISLFCVFIHTQCSHADKNTENLSLSVGQSMWLNKPEGTGDDFRWVCNNNNLLVEEDDIVLAKEAGQATLQLKNDNQTLLQYDFTIKDAETVRFAYADNCRPEEGKSINFFAITDLSANNVRFSFDGKSVESKSKSVDNNVIVWQSDTLVIGNKPFTVTIDYFKDGSWVKSGKTIHILGTSSNDPSLCERCISSQCVDFIAKWEGFLASLRKCDPLSRFKVRDIGHGHVIPPLEPFYNNITMSEAKALLFETLNKDYYAKKVNEFLISNQIKFNQNQFDALVSLCYNLNTKWMEDSNLKNIILDCKNPHKANFATVAYERGINVRSEPSLSAKIIKAIPFGEEVVVLSNQKYNDNWYHVKTKSGLSGFCFDEGLNITSKEYALPINFLESIDRENFTNTVLKYHHGNYKCLRGLLFRRIDEVEMFLFGDYKKDGNINKLKFPIPDCIKESLAM